MKHTPLDKLLGYRRFKTYVRFGWHASATATEVMTKYPKSATPRLRRFTRDGFFEIPSQVTWNSPVDEGGVVRFCLEADGIYLFTDHASEKGQWDETPTWSFIIIRGDEVVNIGQNTVAVNWVMRRLRAAENFDAALRADLYGIDLTASADIDADLFASLLAGD